MAKRGKGKLRTALANHTARSQQRAYKKKEGAREGKQSKKCAVFFCAQENRSAIFAG